MRMFSFRILFVFVFGRFFHTEYYPICIGMIPKPKYVAFVFVFGGISKTEMKEKHPS